MAIVINNQGERETMQFAPQPASSLAVGQYLAPGHRITQVITTDRAPFLTVMLDGRPAMMFPKNVNVMVAVAK